ncbi:hypothetical protein LGK95_08375 [Clostridium algoriphilum]|uniref:hypothetical protein n=1 Tax=Clostridium algoriphilum TaxID=198347 RepID=UPI001CF31EC1|nr:hypothetical protein [Clostridium algoriphilum]MCB2293535.1 hypothetical protein [Clostridium algoriphilum]
MDHKRVSLKILILPLIILVCMSFIPSALIPLVNKPKDSISITTLSKRLQNEKRGIPHYDYIIGKDNWPHFRVFFWVPENAIHYKPYADSGVNTDVSEHGPVSKWSVVTTKQTKDNEKLVFIYVPKSFVILYGNGFANVIHLEYH